MSVEGESDVVEGGAGALTSAAVDLTGSPAATATAVAAVTAATRVARSYGINVRATVDAAATRPSPPGRIHPVVLDARHPRPAANDHDRRLRGVAAGPARSTGHLSRAIAAVAGEHRRPAALDSTHRPRHLAGPGRPGSTQTGSPPARAVARRPARRPARRTDLYTPNYARCRWRCAASPHETTLPPSRPTTPACARSSLTSPDEPSRPARSMAGTRSAV